MCESFLEGNNRRVRYLHVSVQIGLDQETRKETINKFTWALLGFSAKFKDIVIT